MVLRDELMLAELSNPDNTERLQPPDQLSNLFQGNLGTTHQFNFAAAGTERVPLFDVAVSNQASKGFQVTVFPQPAGGAAMIPANVDRATLFVEFGAGGVFGLASAIDIGRGGSVVIPGSRVRGYLEVVVTGAMALIYYGFVTEMPYDREHNASLHEDRRPLAIGGDVIFDLLPFSKKVEFCSGDNPNDHVFIEMLNAAGVTINGYEQAPGQLVLPQVIPYDCTTVRLTNLGPAIIAQATLRQYLVF